MRKKAVAIVLIIIGILLFPTQVLAYTTIDEWRDGTLTLTYELPEISFSIFRVADVSKTVKYALSEGFENYPVVLDDLDSEGWRDAAQTLAGYAARDQISPLRVGKTDDKGKLIFENLEIGLYLVEGDAYITEEDVRYSIMPFLVSLPTLTDSDEWDYEPVVIPKYDKEILPKNMSLEVIKLWKNDSYANRPKEINVQLLKNGEVYGEVVLDASDGWKHEWTDLEPKANWDVVERQVPGDYTVKVSKAEGGFVITNTGIGIISSSPSLPQTGQLWWPVPVLAMTGVFLFVMGLRCGKRRE